MFYNLIIRQSLINDIVTCPYMAYNRWVLNKSIGKADTDGTGNINIEQLNDNFDFGALTLGKNQSEKSLKKEERVESISKTLPSLPIKQDSVLSFKAERICRLGFPINCTEFWSMCYLIYY